MNTSLSSHPEGTEMLAVWHSMSLMLRLDLSVQWYVGLIHRRVGAISGQQAIPSYTGAQYAITRRFSILHVGCGIRFMTY